MLKREKLKAENGKLKGDGARGGVLVEPGEAGGDGRSGSGRGRLWWSRAITPGRGNDRRHGGELASLPCTPWFCISVCHPLVSIQS